MNVLKPVLSAMIATGASASAEWLPLWPGDAPGGAAPVAVTEKAGRLADGTVPQYEIHLPQPSKRTGAAVIILPGGAYTSLAMGHGGSKRRLPGAQPDAALEARVSVEKRVTGRTPPCFIVHAADDHAVPVRNSLEFAARCAENRVPVVCHVFAQGGHGFGMRGRETRWAGHFCSNHGCLPGNPRRAMPMNRHGVYKCRIGDSGFTKNVSSHHVAG
jgi:acetyl esterase/lipase